MSTKFVCFINPHTNKPILVNPAHVRTASEVDPQKRSRWSRPGAGHDLTKSGFIVFGQLRGFSGLKEAALSLRTREASKTELARLGEHDRAVGREMLRGIERRRTLAVRRASASGRALSRVLGSLSAESSAFHEERRDGKGPR